MRHVEERIWKAGRAFHREGSAELAYRRLVELSDNPVERDAIDRIREDEVRHGNAFRLLAAALTDDDHLAQGTSTGDLAASLAPRPAARWAAASRPGERSTRPETLNTARSGEKCLPRLASTTWPRR